jgi:hypothetical protein
MLRGLIEKGTPLFVGSGNYAHLSNTQCVASSHMHINQIIHDQQSINRLSASYTIVERTVDVDVWMG